MTWRAVHPSITEERKIPADDPSAPTFTLGFWPPLEAEKTKLYVGALRNSTDAPADPELAAKKANQDLQAFWAMARFGVRGWSGIGSLLCSTEKVQVDGREHVVLTDDACQILYHSGLL